MWMDANFQNQSRLMLSCPGVFHGVIFLFIDLCACLHQDLFEFHQLFFKVYLSGFSVIFYLFLNFVPKLLCLLCIQWLICLYASPSTFGWIFFHYFGRSCFMWMAWLRLVFLSPIFFRLFLPVVLSDLSAVVFLLLFILLCIFPSFRLFSQFLYSISQSYFPSSFCIFIRFSWGIRILSLTSFTHAKINLLTSMILLVGGFLKLIYLLFRFLSWLFPVLIPYINFFFVMFFY